uniref:Uncharacterized protein n=1 Tax=Hemiselmis tepida TaxID=464990 RepID=A0A7S0W436_9CRYP|mmetsp:Transcript_37883/g.96870  ORF Transcript_37883/g.96870 Transcript_37883/m.96870 type:complete len:316 (+) Transcript_37883:83-1030(+)|eukprot:CAMPEP_0174932420 /NCGR_PEP_ID=MMETSP1355-20121228/35688_1 /TAXON_ID=464990 /ORGANISM="Hemiselmis tepida, Strain CCMP443" /LENGTH=315 /DNA_ID=CAMNT_0016178829 /DNA_START=73 /DNA_END=1020 /DNA_ORIENTATION=-
MGGVTCEQLGSRRRGCATEEMEQIGEEPYGWTDLCGGSHWGRPQAAHAAGCCDGSRGRSRDEQEGSGPHRSGGNPPAGDDRGGAKRWLEERLVCLPGDKRLREPRADVANPAIARLRAVSRSASPAGSFRQGSGKWSPLPSPRGAGGGPEGLMADTGRSTARSLAIIAVALVALTAASVPKLTRIDIDVDYSPMMRDCKLSLDSLARPQHQQRGSGPSGRWSSPSSPSIDTVRSASDMLAGGRKEAQGDTRSLRLRGGETSPQFSPTDSAMDLRIRGGCVASRNRPDEDWQELPPDFHTVGMRYRPKLSRTVDVH